MNDAVAMLTSRAPVGSQATTIEQSRAVAEVQAAVVLAQSRPRVIASACNQMREVCKVPALAERAFFRFPRGGEVVSGASVHLARELARCWGNVDYGVKELYRSDEDGVSEMLAFAWDLETNARVENTFLVPHKRDTRSGAKMLTDMRDIYENNANMAARRLRECIFSILPIWYTDEAREICQHTLQHGGGKPLPQRIAHMMEAFSTLGISQVQVEKRAGRPLNSFTPEDIAQMTVIFKSIRRGEISAADEFEPEEAKPMDAPFGETETKKAEKAAPKSMPPAQADAFDIPVSLQRGKPPAPTFLEPRVISATTAKEWSEAFSMMLTLIDPARVDEAVEINMATIRDLRASDIELHDATMAAVERRRKERA